MCTTRVKNGNFLPSADSFLYHILMRVQQQPVYALMSGLPGSGKSTLAAEVKRRNPTIEVISTDIFIEEYAQKHDLTYADAFNTLDFNNVLHKMNVQRERAFIEGKSIIHDQTNLTRRKRAKVCETIPANYWRTLIFVDTTLDVIEARLKARAQATGKVISTRILQNFMATMEPPDVDHAEPFQSLYTVDGTTLDFS